jgi:hypothetical protein
MRVAAWTAVIDPKPSLAPFRASGRSAQLTVVLRYDVEQSSPGEGSHSRVGDRRPGHERGLAADRVRLWVIDGGHKALQARRRSTNDAVRKAA